MIQDETLPYVVVTLFDAALELRKVTNPLTKSLRVLESIKNWENTLLACLADDGSPIPVTNLIAKCRNPPPENLMYALELAGDALQALSLQEWCADHLGIPAELAHFWGEEGKGYWALELSKKALDSTWWLYRKCLRRWIDGRESELRRLFDEVEEVLREEAERDSVGRVLKLSLQQVYLECSFGNVWRRDLKQKDSAYSSFKDLKNMNT